LKGKEAERERERNEEECIKHKVYVVICDRTGSRFSSLSRLVMRSFSNLTYFECIMISTVYKTMKLFGNFYMWNLIADWRECALLFWYLKKIFHLNCSLLYALWCSRELKNKFWKFHWTRANFFCLFLSTTCRITKGHRNSTRENDRMLTPNPSTLSELFSFIFWQRISWIED
jgi:hypothetical protein